MSSEKDFEPKRKRLKQSTLEFSFSRQSSIKSDTSEETHSDVVEVKETMDRNDKQAEERRKVIAAAAERRRRAASAKSNSKRVGLESSPNQDKTEITQPCSSRTNNQTKSNQRTKNFEFSKKKNSVFDCLEATGKTDSNLKTKGVASTSSDGTELNYKDFLKRENNEKMESGKKDVSEVSCPVDKKVNRNPAKGVVFEEADSPTLELDNSYPLFSDSESQNESSQPLSPEEDKHPQKRQTSVVIRGVKIDELLRAPDCRASLPPLKPCDNHTILFRPHIRPGSAPLPFPDEYRDKWDSKHVRMPCSPDNLYPVENKNGKKEVKSRWELVETSLLSRELGSSIDLEEAILAYNTRYDKKWNFEALHLYFTEVLDSQESTHFFETILPKIVNLALQLPKLCTQPIPLLRKQCDHTLTLTQQQAASLLANAFFCTFPRRNAQQKKSEYSSFPDINFNRLYGSRNPRKVEKIKCLINYFRRVTMKTPTGTISFTRKVLKNYPKWDKSEVRLSKIHLSTHGVIEEDGAGMLQMDFANKYLGGGVLGFGLVQEEIRFVMCPELILSRLFTESLDDNECLIIKGAETYNTYSGYANTFVWTGNFNDSTTRDIWGRRETEIVALDAVNLRRHDDQFKADIIKRELNKAYCGFFEHGVPKEHLPAVATGNWGCGAFGGDPRLKALLQLMAASEAKRDLAYFTFHDAELCTDISNMCQFLSSQAVTVGELYAVLHKYRQKMLESKKKSFPQLYPFIYDLYTNYDCDSDATEGSDPGADGIHLKEQFKGGEGTSGVMLERSLSPDYKVDTP